MASLAIVFALLAAYATAQTIPCQWTDVTSGASFDLSSLTKTTGDWTGSDGSNQYTMNVCAPSNGGPKCTDAGFGICQYGPNGFKVGIGKWDATQPWSLIDPTNPGKGIQVVFTNGGKCVNPGGFKPRTATVKFTCPGGEAPPAPTFQETLAQCMDTIVFATDAACPLSAAPSGLSGGWVFIIILCTVVPVYIFGGCLFKYKTKGTRGVESCPNIDFWSTIPGYVKDGFKFTWRKVRCVKDDRYDEL